MDALLKMKPVGVRLHLIQVEQAAMKEQDYQQQIATILTTDA